MKRSWLMFVALLPLALACGSTALAAGGQGEGVFRGISTAVRFDVSPPLQSIKPLPVVQGQDRDKFEERENPFRGPLGPQDLDAAVQSSTRGAEIVAPATSFDGPSNTSSVSPPDPVGDVGPNHYVAMSNLSFAVYSKTGTLLYGPALNNTLWAGFGGPCQTENSGDPVVLHDQLSDRWILTQFTSAGPTFYNCVAVSTTPDPTGSYYRYAFSTGSNFPDYPKYGVWPDALYISTREFQGGGPFVGVGAYAVNRAQLVAGNPAPQVISFLVTPASAGGAFNIGDGLLPTDLDGSTLPAPGTPNFFVGAMDNGGPYGAPMDALTIWKFTADFTTPANSSFVLANTVPITAYDTMPAFCSGRSCVPQQGTANRIDHLGYRQRPLHRAAYRNFGTHQSIVTNQSVEASATMSGIRWWEIRNPNGTPVIYQESTYAPGLTDGIHRWMGSIAMDRVGNMALGYSASSATTYPSVQYTGRLAGDPLGTMPQGEGVIIAGTGAQTGSQRWGDYTSMNVDPVDDCTFWYVNEYVPATSSIGWRLRIGSFKFPSCGPNVAPAITPVASLSVPRGETTNAQIATVFDPDTAPPALTVSATGAPAGIIVANFVLTATAPAGTYNVTADIIAACGAAATGPVNLQVTDGIGAPATGSFTLNTTNASAGATLTGGANLCAGESTTLSVALTGAGPWNITWSDGFVQNGVTTSPATRVVSPAATATYTVTAVSGANGCAGTASGSALVTVNPRPTATVTGGGTVCAGTNSTMNVALTGTAPWTIRWNDGVVQIAGTTPATRQVSPTFAQSFSVVTLSDSKCAGGTSTGVAAFVVKPVPSAVITAAGGVCFSSTGNAASVPDGGPGTTYAWAITGGTITAGAGTNSVTFTANASGNVVLTATVTKDGCPSVGTKTIPIQTLPSAPVPAIPSNGSTYSGAFVSWTHAGGTYHDVYLDTVNPPEKLIFSGQTNNFEAFIPSWVPGVTYYWKVIARNGCGTASSQVQSFIAGSCPWTGAAPVLTSPANGASGIGATANLVWTPVSGAAHYDVYVGTNSGSLTRYDVVEAPQNSLAVPVSPGVTYFWKVVAVPVCGSAVAATSSTNTFTTSGTPFGGTAFAPSFFNRWETGTVTLSGSGFTAGMQLFTDFHGADAGTLVPAVFTNSFSSPNQLQATLIGNPAAPAGRYDAGVTLSGIEEGRLLQAMALRAFTDVTEADYYYLSSARMADAGIMEPDFNTSTLGPQFSPSTNVPRALMAEYLAKSYQYWRYRTTALPSATCTASGAGSTDFPDVPCSHPNWLAIHWIKTWGVTQGSPCAQGLCFYPNNNVTRAEMVTFIERLRQTGVLNTLLSTVGETDPGCAVA
ncbi:MAG: S-layer homology domain-containing protein, partial [Acidobacteria bacterium]|nr:S-layer homology domain-containing protein [Acidobacteriota bacterium]